MAFLMRHLLTKLIIISVFYFTCSVSSLNAQSLVLDEKKIEAGLLYNFLKYTTWPKASFSSTGDKLQVCLLGGDPFAGYLFPMEGRTAQQYVIDVEIITTIAKAESCHILFIHRSKSNRLNEILRFLRRKHILTVSDIDNFSEAGGMVEFSMGADKRIHLYINREVLDESGIIISPRLLQLAELGRKNEAR